MKKIAYLIIGEISGKGLILAKKLVENGSSVILVSSSDEVLKSNTIQLLGADCLTYCYDLNDIFHIEDIFEFVNKNQIILSGMIYFTDTALSYLSEDNTSDFVEQVFRKNVFSFIECARCFYKKEYSYEGSKIVAVISTAVNITVYHQTLYGSSKAALISSVKLMSRELLNRDIKINCLSLGVTDADILDNRYTGDINLKEKIYSVQPLGIIPAERGVSMICTLLSFITDYLTGAEWTYDGGALLN